jgi:hypothetical protein
VILKPRGIGSSNRIVLARLAPLPLTNLSSKYHRT